MGRSNDIERPGSKVLIIGLDGGTWSVLDRFMELGHMPFLKRLCGEGYRANLASTIPPLTPVAWSSFATGMNPGKHGVFGFLAPQSEPGSYSPPPVRRECILAPSLWRRLSEVGVRTTILSVPLTYPPEPVNGFMVSGMFTPDEAPDSTFPASLAGELRSQGAMPRFRLEYTSKEAARRRRVGFGEALRHAPEEYFTDVRDMTERLRRAALTLMEKPWDLLSLVFVATDRVQHVLWPEVMSSDPESELGRLVAELYSLVDSAVEELVHAAGRDTVTILMSDHGFGPCGGTFSMMRWLMDAGFAHHRPRRLYGAAKRAVTSLGLADLAGRAVNRRHLGTAVRRSFIPLDWSRTRAYFQPGTYGIRVNLRGREANGIVEPGDEYQQLRAELLERVLSIEDPRTGIPVVTEAWPVEDVYEGGHLDWAPDLLLQPNPDLGYHLVPGNLSDRALVHEDARMHGSHRPDGILLVAGRGVRPNPTARRLRIVDIAPTVLWLLSQPVPPELDGRVISDAFVGEPARREFVSPECLRDASGETGNYSAQDEAQIVERLRGLGYVD
ncbi:alkaline phosphatase family protein [bacterium]|nr:alkaline phosphatase family protein [bacterium]